MTPETKRKIGEARKGKKHSEETKEKIRISAMGNKRAKGMIPWNKGKKFFPKISEEEREARSERMRGGKNPMFGKPVSKERKKIASERHRGAGNHSWKGGLEFRKKTNDRRDSAYGAWRKQVWLRDNFACKIANPDCKGRLEAHHILGWAEYPELRYEINNGITLCHAHHPRKRAEEKRLSPFFQELVSVSKDMF